VANAPSGLAGTVPVMSASREYLTVADILDELRPGEAIESLISRADAAMYEVKKAHHAGPAVSG
jgi:hypothetical protein